MRDADLDPPLPGTLDRLGPNSHYYLRIVANPFLAIGELVVAYGTKELPELSRQSIEYAQEWVERGLSGHLLPIDGANHFTILEALARPQGMLTQALIDMIGG